MSEIKVPEIKALKRGDRIYIEMIHTGCECRVLRTEVRGDKITLVLEQYTENCERCGVLLTEDEVCEVGMMRVCRDCRNEFNYP